MYLFSNSQWPGGIFKNPQSELALYIVSSTENARISFEVKDEEAPIAVEKKTEREKKEKHTMIEYYTSPKQGW